MRGILPARVEPRVDRMDRPSIVRLNSRRYSILQSFVSWSTSFRLTARGISASLAPVKSNVMTVGPFLGISRERRTQHPTIVWVVRTQVEGGQDNRRGWNGATFIVKPSSSSWLSRQTRFLCRKTIIGMERSRMACSVTILSCPPHTKLLPQTG